VYGGYESMRVKALLEYLKKFNSNDEIALTMWSKEDIYEIINDRKTKENEFVTIYRGDVLSEDILNDLLYEIEDTNLTTENVYDVLDEKLFI